MVADVKVGKGGRTIRADRLLLATGRRSNTDQIGIEAAGFAANARGEVEVDLISATLSASFLAASLCAITPAVRQPSGSDYGSAPTQGEVSAKAAEPGEQVFHIATVHLDAKTNVKGDAAGPAEPFPETAEAAAVG